MAAASTPVMLLVRDRVCPLDAGSGETVGRFSFLGAVFLSGAAGLLLQTLWVRRLGFVFGNTTVSVSLVLAAFFFGMAAGSRFVGTRADGATSPRRFYSRLELGIAFAAVAAWLALSELGPVYVWVYRTLSGRSVGATAAVEVALTFAAIAFPATLMGATLPVMVRCVTRDRDAPVTTVGRVYAMNTLGALVGLVGGAFLAIELFGLRGAYVIAVSSNVAAAVLAAAAARGSEQVPAPPAEAPIPAGRSWLDALAFANGFLGIGYEVLWIRLWSFVSLHSADSPIGQAPAEMSSTYVFSFIVALVLFGIAAGSALVPVVRRTGRLPSLSELAIVEALLGIWGLATVAIERFVFFDGLASKLVEVTAIVLPMAMLMGASFPLLAAQFVDRPRRSADRFGRFYSANTLGSALGPLLVGLVFLPAKGTYACLTLFAVANLAIASVLIAVSRDGDDASSAGPHARRMLALGTALLAALVVLPFPSASRLSATGPQILLEEDNSVAHTLVLDHGTGYRELVVNNHSVSGLDVDNRFGRATIEVPVALLGRVPADILVLCVGTGGSWAGASRYDARITAVDINPAVFRAVLLLHPPDRLEKLARPGSRGVVADARNVLLLDDGRYDLINADPAPPITQPGMVNLHTAEFYRLVRARLKPGGVLIQRLSREPDSAAFYPELLRAISDVFPEVTVWAFLGRGLDVIASERPLDVLDADPLLIEPEVVAHAFRAFLFGRREVEEYVAGVEPVTDDRPSLEFNLLSRWRDDRFEGRRLRNLERLDELRRPLKSYIRIVRRATP